MPRGRYPKPWDYGAFAHPVMRMAMLAALVLLVLPQTAAATVYDKTLHDQLVEPTAWPRSRRSA